MRYWLVMPAAGTGRRFGGQVPKQYAELHGRTVIEWSLATFLYDSRCAGVVVVLSSDDVHWPSVAARLPRAPPIVPELPQTSDGEEPALPVSAAAKLPQVVTTAGGRERGESVRNGLAALADRAVSDDWVLVHDAARPCISRRDVDKLLDAVGTHGVGGLLAAPAADTLKRAGEDGEVSQTVDRNGLWRALTPQMFKYGKLSVALDLALGQSRSPTDEAQALEWVGERPVVVEGSTTNIKVTNADDLVIAMALMRPRDAW